MLNRFAGTRLEHELLQDKCEDALVEEVNKHHHVLGRWCLKKLVMSCTS